MLPTHLALPFVKPSKWKTGYLYVTGITAALLLAGWQWLPQQLPVEIIPILLLITIKTLFQRN
jgi:MFS superfamily sulfate permease-like transporter